MKRYIKLAAGMFNALSSTLCFFTACICLIEKCYILFSVGLVFFLLNLFFSIYNFKEYIEESNKIE